MDDDERWMDMALAEARKGVGRTAPNPPVGAVVVRDGCLLGAGWHRAAGCPHAEREALAAVRAAHGEDGARGSTVYVTLEPCSTHGRTPPCTDGLIEAGVARVVYACADRNPAHEGRADELLRQAGVEVRRGVREAEALRLLRPFFRVQECGRPWVIWKTAMSLDGRLTRPPGEGMWLTGPEARRHVQHLRSECEAILTSGETVRRDDPQLTLRLPECMEGRPQPWRVVVTRDPSSLPREARVLADEWRQRTIVTGGEPEEILRRLVAEQNVMTVMIEAGGRLAGDWLARGLVDEVVAWMAPRLCGGPVVAAAGDSLEPPQRLTDITYLRVGDDVVMRGLIG